LIRYSQIVIEIYYPMRTFWRSTMFEINLFNSAQIFDQIFAFICVYLLTSLSAKVRFYGFVVGTIGFVPGVYLLIETQLWWLLAAMPLWVFINYKGLVNNWREFKSEETKA